MEGKGYKFDGDKVRLELVDPYFVEDMARVFQKALIKYKPFSWRLVPNPQVRYLAALERHLLAMKKGDMIDMDDGLPHATHAAGCCMILEHFRRFRNKHGVYTISMEDYYTPGEIQEVMKEMEGIRVKGHVSQGEPVHIIVRRLIEGDLNIEDCYFEPTDKEIEECLSS